MKTKLTSVDYLGFTAVDRRFSTSMLPWILLEIRQRGTKDKLCLAVEGGALLAYDVNFELQFTHKLQNIMRFTQVQTTPTEFLYLIKDSKDTMLHCFLFQAQSPEEVSELFNQMKELSPHGGSLQSLTVPQTPVTPATGNAPQTTSAFGGRRVPTIATNRGFQTARAQQAAIENQLLKSGGAGGNAGVAQSKSYSAGLNKSGSSLSNDNGNGATQIARSMSNAANLTSLCADISPCNSHFFEVLYIGKIKVSHKKVPETLIDDALAKFKQFELEKMKAAQMRRNSLLSTQADSVTSENGSLESLISQHHTRRVEFAPLPLPHSIKKKYEEQQSLSRDDSIDLKLNDVLMTPSLTPLRGDKQFFPDDETEEKNDGNNAESNIEKEFDDLSKGRVQKPESENNTLTLTKKSFPVALEPNVLILNWNQNDSVHNLSTLTEDDNESGKDNSLPSEISADLNVTKKANGEKIEPPKEVDLNMNIKTVITPQEPNKIYFPVKENKPIPPKDLILKQDMNGNVNDSETGFVLKKEVSFKSDVEFGSTDSNLSETKDYFNSKVGDGREKPGLKGSMMPENKPFARDRSASIGTLELNKTPIAQLIGDQNRTMLFQVGRSELRLISPDRKQVLLHRRLRDVASCAQGIKNIDHLGFICREPGVECFVGYVFKCQSEGVACDIVGAITQAFVAHTEMVKQGKEKSPIFSCEHCPMVWYHKLCQDIEGMNEKRVHAAILRRIEQLPEEEQEQIITKYQGGTEDLYEVGEHNAFLMMLLRAHCEAKQQRHVHDTAENRSEFLNQYLGGSTIFMKAKRSLSSSFDHLLKRKGSKDDFGQIPKDLRKETSPMPHASTPTRDSSLDLHLESSQTSKTNFQASGNTKNTSSTPNDHGKDNMSLNGGQEADTNGHHQNGHEHSPQLKSPMMDIFMKLGSSPSPKAPSPDEHHHVSHHKSGKESEILEDKDEGNQGSWRQAIFNRITQKGIAEELEGGDQNGAGGPVVGSGNELLRRPPSFSNLNQANPKKRNRAELRELWKKGINQAILLIRMEKENARLRARQEVSAVKRIKLEYEDIGGCANENSKLWDVLTAPRDSRISTKVDSQMLLQAIRTGVPRAKRGEVWYFLAEQFCLRQPPPDTKNFPNYGMPYEALLKQLTSHQHAILIDLGRTFPSHTYFSSPMGPGQLALFNLLKAYSLLDPEVGYCQGLSFVAGVLLLHLDEAEAFLMLRHLMFRRGLRRQYLPDMVALQIELYQLSRLLKDHLPELYEKFDQYDVSPTLYAAPWILTVFTSQFPLGFVTRVFDLLFLESTEVIFRVAIALLDIHKDGLMLCDSFEEIMEYLKHKMPNIDKIMLDKVIKLAFTLDFGRQLNEYQVEYHVLQEEMAAIAPKMEALAKLEVHNKNLMKVNRHLSDQLETEVFKVSSLQASHLRLENQVKSLEQTVASLARYIGTSYDKKTELPTDIRRLCQQVQQNDRKTLGALGQKLGHSFASKFSSTDFTEDSGSDPDDTKSRKPGILKTGLSAPNLFHKNVVIDNAKKDDANTKSKNNVAFSEPDLDKKKQYLSLQKSYSCNAGLIAGGNKSQEQKVDKAKESKQIDGANAVNKLASNLKGYPLRVLNEDFEYIEKDKPKDAINKHQDALKSSAYSDTSSIASSVSSGAMSPTLESAPKQKSSGFFAHSHEQIRQEKLQAEQLKKDFDDNLKRLDARLSPQVSQKYNEDVKNHNLLDLLKVTEKLNNGDLLKIKDKNNAGNILDSGLGTPISPSEKNIHSAERFQLSPQHNNNSPKCGDLDLEPIISNHPLVGCDLDIKFDVHATKLKSLKPSRLGHIGSRNVSVESSDSRN